MQVIYRAPGPAAPPGSPAPPGPPDAAGAADAELLAGLYAYPADLAGRAWVRANMVASADGAAELAGRSGGLGGPADRQLLDRRRDGGKSVLDLLLAKFEWIVAGVKALVPQDALEDRSARRHLRSPP